MDRWKRVNRLDFCERLAWKLARVFEKVCGYELKDENERRKYSKILTHIVELYELIEGGKFVRSSCSLDNRVGH